MCCAPELWDLLDDDIEQNVEQESQTEIRSTTSLIEENERLKQELAEYEENEKGIIKEAEGISSDNTRLVQEVNSLNEELDIARIDLSNARHLNDELSKLRHNNKALALENSKLKQMNKEATVEIRNLKTQCKDLESAHKQAQKRLTNAAKEINSLKKDYKDLHLTHEKAQEIAVSVKNKLNRSLKDAEGQIQEKNRIIREITKSNEKLKAENISYLQIQENSPYKSKKILTYKSEKILLTNPRKEQDYT